MKLILVRHGRTIANVMGALDTAFPGNPLDEVGLAQAASLPGRLREAGHLEDISSLWVSPILRARQTIAPVERATGLQAQICSGLREVLAGDLEMNTDAASIACYTDTTRAWMIGRLHARLPGSPEDGAGTVLRVWTALVAATAAGADPAWIANHPMTNTAFSVVMGDHEHGWRLEDWAEGTWRAADPAGRQR